MTSGQRLDTNSQWLSQQLGELGVRTIRHTTVGDDLAANIEAFQQAAARADMIISTGGLGPTLDDLTRDALATAFDRPLELDPDSLTHIEQLFARRSRPMPERNRLQAMLPRGSQVVFNPHGSAPGIDLACEYANRQVRIFALPGVPAEMKQMWAETLAPRIGDMLGAGAGKLRYHCLKVYGIGESELEARLPTLIARDRYPAVGITVSKATITLRIAGRTKTEDEFQQLIAPTVDEIKQALGFLIFGEGEDELEHAVLRKLSQRGLKLASVEVGASSLVGDWMLNACSGTNAYAGSLAFPSVEEAAGWLGASSATHSTLDEPTAVLLAKLARERFKADVGIAFGIYPTQYELEQSKGVFKIAYGLVTPEGERSDMRSIGGHPEVVTARIAKTALDFVRHRLG